MFIRKVTLLALVICSAKLIGQKDTLRLYYSGLATKLLDSNEVKIGNWAATLKGSKSDVEIHAYYDKSEFKDIAKQRIDDIALVVVRKARDYSNITFQGPKKSDKSRRSRVDIIYTKPLVQEEQKTKE
ncbi:MAG: hypothetical protein ACK5QC_16265 [Bacteroidota bacterium]|jgi:hypothetical protein|nr:hypothetical protein [Bacteroidota bacterium]MCA6442680.1 hypothetical protein [Bacteroidota bacterium]